MKSSRLAQCWPPDAALVLPAPHARPERAAERGRLGPEGGALAKGNAANASCAGSEDPSIRKRDFFCAILSSRALRAFAYSRSSWVGGPVGDGAEPCPRAALGAGLRSGSRGAFGLVRTRASQQRPPPGRALTLGAATSGRPRSRWPTGRVAARSGETGAARLVPGRSGRGDRKRNEAGEGGGNRADEGEPPPRKEADPFGGRCSCSGTRSRESARL